MRYPIHLAPDDNETLLVTSPDFPELTTFGADESDALDQARRAFIAVISQYMDRKLDIPPPSPARGRPWVTLPPLVSAKVALYQALRESGLSNVQLARRLGVTETIARRLVDPTHASRIEKLDEALAVLGKSLDVTVRQVA